MYVLLNKLYLFLETLYTCDELNLLYDHESEKGLSII